MPLPPEIADIAWVGSEDTGQAYIWLDITSPKIKPALAQIEKFRAWAASLGFPTEEPEMSESRDMCVKVSAPLVKGKAYWTPHYPGCKEGSWTQNHPLFKLAHSYGLQRDTIPI